MMNMETIKCDRLKTFREELPTKKFQFLSDNISIHKVKLIHGDANNQNKANEAGGKVLSLDEEENEKEEIQQITTTGLFKDDLRRIDLILVVRDDPYSSTDSLRTAFLTNIVKSGLEIEVEPGQMPCHKNLFFAKIHAPDSVLADYNEIFAVKRNFVNNRLDFIGSKLNRIKNILKIFPRDYEREWIKIVRKTYVRPYNYSNYERSLVVYKILLYMPFGDHVNFNGIHRLLKRNIILDVFALHDGPYFFIPKQTVREANARQLLYYNWAGLQNLLGSQPLHLIHEYFGPKVAFYFAFYEYFNKALAVASVAGIITTVLPFIDKSEDILRKLICESEVRMCPYCDNWTTCPYRLSKEYCFSAAINVVLDNPYTPYFAIFIVIWAFTFITLWRRKECFLKWMWEVGARNIYYKTAIRPEFEINYKPPRKSLKTGLKFNESGYYKLFRYSTSTIIIISYVLAVIPIISKSLKLHDSFFDAFIGIKKKEKWWDYVGLAVFQTLFVLIGSALEMVYHYSCYYLVDVENHSSYKAYDNSLITKQFGFSMVVMYSFMSYYAWMVGQYVFLGRCPDMTWKRYSLQAFHHFRLVFTSWVKPWINIQNDCNRYCWPYTCVNELGILLVVLVLIKVVFFRIANYVSSLWTDYHRGGHATIPCWEREYRLKTADEAYFTKKYFMLGVQFTMVTLFVSSFPLTPLLILIINVWDIRHVARQLLLTRRRPILIRNPGIGVWNNIFKYVSYGAIITNALTLAFNTKMIMRYYFKSEKIPLNETLDKQLVHLRTVGGIYRSKDCHSPDWLIRDMYGNSLWGLKDKTWFTRHYHLLIIYKIIFIFIFINIMVCATFLIQQLYPPCNREIREANDAERRLKTFYRNYMRREKTNE